MTKRLRWKLLFLAVALPLLWPVVSLASAAEQGQRRVVKGS